MSLHPVVVSSDTVCYKSDGAECNFYEGTDFLAF